MERFNKHPIVGILTAKGKASPLTGNFKLFRFLALELAKKNGFVYIITPEALINEQLQYGYIYDEERNGWLKVNHPPSPTIIYNRIPFRKSEHTQPYKAFLEWCHNQFIPLFNPGFFTKYDIYQVLQKSPLLRQHLPYTELLHSQKQLQHLLTKFSSLYLKPNEGSKGNGILVITKMKNGLTVQNHESVQVFPSVQQFWKSKLAKVTEKTKYIVQEHLPLLTYENKTIDFRIWTHKVQQEWTVSGIGVRQSKQNGITTHVLKGGSIVHYDDIATANDSKILTQLVSLCGQQLERTYGTVKEFSMDIGKTKQGEFFIFEVNSKPMKFDEAGIYEKGLQNLVKIFLELTN